MVWRALLFLVLCAGFGLGDVRGQTSSGSKPCWLLITTHELAGALEPLALRRQQQGFEVIKIVRDPQTNDDQWSANSIRDQISKVAQTPDRATYVLLVGDWNAANRASFIPQFKGQHGRMQQLLTDHLYGLPDNRNQPTVAVGRYPARNADDAQRFVEKVVAFEDQAIGPWTNRLNLWVGHPGGNSAMEKKLGETIVQSAVSQSLGRLHPAWSGNCVIDFPNTAYSVDRPTFRQRMQADLTQGQCFTIYAGHSSAGGIWSEDQFVMTRNEWQKIQVQDSPGIVLTTGCFSCQMQGADGVGYLTASMLNPHGPVAVMGAYAESYAVHGQLALNAFVDLMARPVPPSRLADYWLTITAGIGSGKMDPLTFWLYDQADGTRGAEPLDKQRLEHLEMWTLLGDPALKIPFLEPSLPLEVQASIGSSEATIELTVPEELVGGTCEFQVAYQPVTKRKQTSMQRDPPSSVMLPIPSATFTATVPLTKPLAAGNLTVRAFATKAGQGKLGVQSKLFESQ